MTRPDMRYWPFEEVEQGWRSIHRVRNGMTDAGVRWAVMGQSGMTPGCNGYAQIPWEGHPWSGCGDYNELDVIVHGGLTYGPQPEYDMARNIEALNDMSADSDHPTNFPVPNLPPIPAREFAEVGGWIGFDTLHAWDRWPDEELARIGLERRRHPGMPDFPVGEHDIEWTLELIIAEAQSLAHQIAIIGIGTKANRKEDDRGQRS